MPTLCTCLYTCLNTRLCACLYTCLCACLYACLYACLCTCLYTHRSKEAIKRLSNIRSRLIEKAEEASKPKISAKQRWGQVKARLCTCPFQSLYMRGVIYNNVYTHVYTHVLCLHTCLYTRGGIYNVYTYAYAHYAHVFIHVCTREEASTMSIHMPMHMSSYMSVHARRQRLGTCSHIWTHVLTTCLYPYVFTFLYICVGFYVGSHVCARFYMRFQ